MAKSAARVTKLDMLDFQPRFAYGDVAEVAEVSGTGDGTALGTGVVRMTRAEIPWTVRYDEVILVLEGQLEIETESGTLSAGPMETIWLPADTKLTYRAESALMFYAIHPADWASE